jgi:hypothetical protein
MALILMVLLIIVVSVGFTAKETIRGCFTSFKGIPGVTLTSTDRLPETSERFRTLKTNTGEVTVSRIDGYRILYNTIKGGNLVNLKVELSDSGKYETDKKGILDNLQFMISHTQGLTSATPLEIEKNGYKIYGLNRNSIDTKATTLGTYILFPGNNTTVYFYFENLDTDKRDYKDMEEFVTIRDKFLDEYTQHINDCKE